MVDKCKKVTSARSEEVGTESSTSGGFELFNAESAGGDSLLTRFLARFPLLPHSPGESQPVPPLFCRLTAKCAKSAKASAASSSIFTIRSATSSLEEDDVVEEALEHEKDKGLLQTQPEAEPIAMKQRKRKKKKKNTHTHTHTHTNKKYKVESILLPSIIGIV